jgi:hypothetical protein
VLFFLFLFFVQIAPARLLLLHVGRTDALARDNGQQWHHSARHAQVAFLLLFNSFPNTRRFLPLVIVLSS